MVKTGKQSRSKKQDFVGKGKITPIQIAFLVDRYLSDNNYAHTRTTFRSEASSLIAKSPVHEAPKSLLSLGAILEEYITLKEQKLWVAQERRRLEQETLRVQNLLSGMQSVMNVYNTGENASVIRLPQPLPLPAAQIGATASQAEMGSARPASQYPMHNSQAMIMPSMASNIQKDPANLSTPVPHHAAGKRKESEYMRYCPVVPKKSRKCLQTQDDTLLTKSSTTETNRGRSPLLNPAAQPSTRDNTTNGFQAQGSTVVKCLFNHEAISSPANPSVPKTPPRASSSQTEKSASFIEVCSTATSVKGHNTSQPVMSSNCMIISSETIRVSPNKQISYYSIEKNQITCSPLKPNAKRSSLKDNVKARLDFGSSEVLTFVENQSPNETSTSESEGGDILDLDLDALDIDFNLSEFLMDFNMTSEGMGLSSKEAMDSPLDLSSWSPCKSVDVEMGSRKAISDFSFTKAGFIEDDNMKCLSSDSVDAMRSVTKCITIVSPVKLKQRNNFGQ